MQDSLPCPRGKKIISVISQFPEGRGKQGNVSTYRLIKPSLNGRLNVFYLFVLFDFHKNIFDKFLSDFLLRDLYQYIESLE